jgi:hypothetical protein
MCAAVVLLVAVCTPRDAARAGVSRANSLSALDMRQTREELCGVRDSLKGTEQGAQAQYALGYLNVFYAAETPQYDSALVEFRRFVAEYPKHDGVGLARTWVRVLESLANGDRERGQCDSLSADISWQVKMTKALRDSTEILRRDFQRVTTESDSLRTRIRLLEEVIEAIEKNP